MTALATLPMIAAVGCVIDYTTAIDDQDQAAGGRRRGEPRDRFRQLVVIATAKAMSGNGTVSGGSTYATNFFNRRICPRRRKRRLHEPDADGDGYQERNDDHRHACPSPANVPTYFMGVLGYSKVTVSALPRRATRCRPISISI